MTRITGRSQETEMSKRAEADSGATDRPGGVRQIKPLPDLLDKTTLVDLDYQDCFVVDVGPSISDRTAEQWARTVLEEAPAPMRGAMVAGARAATRVALIEGSRPRLAGACE